MRTLVLAILVSILFGSCASSGTKVPKPRYHRVWAGGNKYRIDIPVGSRHIRFLQRKRTKSVRMR